MPRSLHPLLTVPILVLALMTLTACEVSIDFPESGIGEIVTCAELDDNMSCLDQSAVFDGHSTINASALATGLRPGDEIAIVWYEDAGEIERMTLPIEAYGSFPIATWLIPDPVLPDGEYVVRFLLNGESLQETMFEVVGVVPEVAEVIACNERPVNANCAPRSTPFDGTETIPFLLVFHGIADGDKLLAQLTLEDQIVADAGGTLDSATTLTIPLTFEPSPALMTGDYLLEIYLNNALAESMPVAIQGPPPGVFDVTTCREMDETKRCVEPADTFDGQETIYAVVHFVDLALDEEITAHWLYGDEEIGAAPYAVEQEGNGTIAFHLAPSSTMPEGQYRVDIRFRDEIAASADFLLERGEEARRSSLREAKTCREVSQEYECIDPTDSFSPTDALHVLLDLVDLTAGETVSAVWFAGNEVVDDAQITAKSGGSGSVYFDLSPDTAFSPGDYAVEIYIGDVLAKRIEIAITVE